MEVLFDAGSPARDIQTAVNVLRPQSHPTRTPLDTQTLPTLFGDILAHFAKSVALESTPKTKIGPGGIAKADWAVPCEGLEPSTR